MKMTIKHQDTAADSSIEKRQEKWVTKLLRSLSSLKKKQQQENIANSSHFNPLSPTEDAEGCDVYSESFEWALSQSKRIKNIAISGPYGSGKSSVIKTFIKKANDTNKKIWYKLFPKYRFLNISLATFKNIQDELTKNDEVELQRQIELSILQQLFFHEKDSKIPDSRFKKIKKRGGFKLFIYSVLILAFFVSILYLFYPTFLLKLVPGIIDTDKSVVFHYITVSVFVFVLLAVIYKSSRSIIGFSIKKLNISSAEIEVGEGVSKSVLNNHLDEIIYFFEATKYNVVIIEDLDRFGRADIFTKLREINFLINSSKKIKRDVVFVYAIKDDMFLDRDRAKFFDFMIPIVPVINFSNSSDKFRYLVEQNGYNVDNELLDSLSFFIDDMRLLYNVMNEFYIYSKKIDGNWDANKLLAMIVYKNVCPIDFVKLSQNDGYLYGAITQKNKYIKEKIQNLDEEIKKIKDVITQAESQVIPNIQELRILYVSKLIEKLSSNGFAGFDVNGKVVLASDFCSDNNNFNKVLNGSVDYFYKYYYNSNETKKYTFKFESIEKEVNPRMSYKQREDIILNKSKVNDLKKQIEEINEEKNRIKKYKLRELFFDKKITIGSDTTEYYDLINILLRNGYIDENYLDYISVFHEGALTRSDYKFLINIKTEKGNEFDYRLNKKDDLIKKIDKLSFEKEYILNFDLVDTILVSSRYEEEKELLFRQLCNEKEQTIKFIENFVDRTGNIELFICGLCKYWRSIWSYINLKSFYSDEKKEKYFRLIIKYAEVADIVAIFNQDKEYINNYADFLNIHDNQAKIEKIIEGLDLRFNSIDIDSPESLLRYVFEGCHYAINSEMIKSCLVFNQQFDEESFGKRNYSAIVASGCLQLIDYIEANISEYIESVFLRLDNNADEKNENYVKLLNNEQINISLIEKVIAKTNAIIEDIKIVDDVNVQALLFKYSKVAAIWENVLEIFSKEENILSDDVVNYLNSIDNAIILSKTEIQDDDDNKGEDEVSNDFSWVLIHATELDDEPYRLLTKAVMNRYNSFNTEDLTRDKIVILIENGIVKYSVEAYEYLSLNFKGTNILLLEKKWDEFKAQLDRITLNESDLAEILRSNKLDTEAKISLINICEEKIIIQSSQYSQKVVQLLIANRISNVKKSLILSLIININVPIENRIELFSNYLNFISQDIIESFLNSLGGEYAEITAKSKKATIEDNTFNRLLSEGLKKLDYISSVSYSEGKLRINRRRKSD